MEEIIDSINTVCGHSFCHRCITESLLQSDECPLCRTDLKRCELGKCTVLQEIMSENIKDLSEQHQQQEQIIQQQDNNKEEEKQEQIQNNIELRKQETDEWIKNRKVNEFKSGDRIDIQDTDLIWCKGEVLDVDMEKKAILIHYDGWSKVYDEFIPINSQRLAPLGFFTSRNNIPKYKMEENVENALYSRIQREEEQNEGNEQEDTIYSNAIRNLLMQEFMNLQRQDNQENNNNNNNND